MPDISMCSSDNCPMKDKCYRSTATASKYQSYSNFEYTCNENSGYTDFMLDKRMEKRKENKIHESNFIHNSLS